MLHASTPVQPQAQLAFAEWVAALLPPAPAGLLLLGSFTDAACAALRARGYQVVQVDWRATAQQALPPAGAQGELLQVRLDTLAPAGLQFDAVLALDLAADIHPLALFDGLDRLLAPHGAAVLAGPGTPECWLDDYASALATRCGFTFEEASPDAPAPVGLARVRLARRSAMPPRWKVSHVLPADFDDIVALFQQVFGHELSPALWHWKYGAGRGNAVMARKDGKAVAHYGGMYRDIVVGGRRERVAQICDVMVQSQERGVLTRQGPFFLMGASWPEIYGPLGFGFPTHRAMKVAEKMGLYTQVGQMAEVRWPPAKTRFRLATRIRPLERGRASDRALVEPLWSAMAHDLRGSAVGVKDWAFLERRYFSHPHNHYEVLVVTARLTGKALGVIVLRRLEGTTCEWLDVIAPLSRLPLMVDQARRMTGRWALPHLYCWITTRHAPLFVACGGREEALDLSIPASSWTRNPQSELFIDKWWLMSGDTDFR